MAGTATTTSLSQPSINSKAMVNGIYDNRYGIGSVQDFLDLARHILLTPGQCITNLQSRADTFGKDFAVAFGVSPHLCALLWEHTQRIQPLRPIHLLWSLYYMRHYPSVRMACLFLRTTDKTLKLHVWQAIKAVAALKNEVIVWNARYQGDKNRTCLVTVDGTDFSINEPSPFNRKWYSHKFKSAGIRYEIAVSIQRGDIVWMNGPFPCGRYPDLRIFRSLLKEYLDEGEMVEADRGYRGDDAVRTSDDYVTEAEKHAKSQARARHETVNGRFKTWKILQNRFRNDLMLHKHVMKAVVTITQLQIEHGSSLFQVQY